MATTLDHPAPGCETHDTTQRPPDRTQPDPTNRNPGQYDLIAFLTQQLRWERRLTELRHAHATKHAS